MARPARGSSGIIQSKILRFRRRPSVTVRSRLRASLVTLDSDPFSLVEVRVRAVNPRRAQATLLSATPPTCLQATLLTAS